MYGNEVLLSLTDQDALWAGIPRDSLIKEKKLVVDKLTQTEHSIWRMAKRILLLPSRYCRTVFLFRLTNWLFHKLKIRILRLRDTALKPFSIQGYELLNTQRQVNLLIFWRA